ncbi:hypothetical protein FACS1894137_01770 [Spirochaetia bacterium]|nr:hypothetical protein FACS1894137_01770 [Spirochaetia bacterium]
MPGKTAKYSIGALAFALSLSLAAPVFGRAKAEEDEQKPLNPQWVLCISAFDVSSLSPGQRILGDVLIRSLAKNITEVDHRIRMSDEESYYHDWAYIHAMEAAGKKLKEKRAERDLLLYKGHSAWRYKHELKAANAAVKKLEEEYRAAEEAVLTVAIEPGFILTKENNDGIYPAPPAPGREYRFCVNKKADAFVVGKVSEFHGRIVLDIRMYTLYTRSFAYEDSFIFSIDDLGTVKEELNGHLTAAVSGAAPSAISVTTDPKEAIVLIKERFAGQGDTGIREYAPGTVEVIAFAEGYENASTEMDLAPGELAELDFKLHPVPEAVFDIDFPYDGGVSLYQGAMYIGEPPMTIRAPRDQFEYIHGETPAGDSTAIIFRAGQTTGDLISMPAAIPPGKDPKPLGTARRKYYGAWTRFWIALPAAVLLSGYTTTYRNIDVYMNHTNANVADTYRTLNAVSTGAWVVFGAVAAESLYRIIRYNYTAGKKIPKTAK